MNYLYAASIQEIQSYIFKTGRLREISGASEIVNQLTETAIVGLIGKEFNKDQLVRAAAGSIIYIFKKDQVNLCKKVVRELPKYVSEKTGGEIQISQAVVEYNEGDLGKALSQIEEKLRAQRNKNSLKSGLGFMGIERARRTGEAAVEINERKYVKAGIDFIGDATCIKLRNENSMNLLKVLDESIVENQIAHEFDELVKGGTDSWMAVIHADGNGLGNLLQNMFNSYQTDKELQQQYRAFSRSLDDANKEAVKEAYKSLDLPKDGSIIPVRPIILGGDDLTIIIRADLAFDFAVEYLKRFEELTQLYSPQKVKLSACAGIAYMKSAYPIYYGLHLAEALCKDAKKMVKEGREKDFESAIAFYKIKDSFTDDLSQLKDRTQKVYYDNGDIDLYFGPYFLSGNGRENSVENLNDKLSTLIREKNKSMEKSASISNLRAWLTKLYQNKSAADLMMKRIISNNPDFANELNLSSVINADNKTIIYDLLTLYSFKR